MLDQALERLTDSHLSGPLMPGVVDNLFAGPEGLGLDDRRNGNVPVPLGYPKQGVLYGVPIQEGRTINLRLRIPMTSC